MHKKFWYQDTVFPQTLFTYMYNLHTIIYKQTTEYINKRAFQLAGEPCYLNGEMPKKIDACPSVSKSTEGHSRIPFQSAILSTICSLHYYPSLQVMLGSCTVYFFCSECTMSILQVHYAYCSLHESTVGAGGGGGGVLFFYGYVCQAVKVMVLRQVILG